MQESQLIESFRKEFGSNPTLTVRAPGRVNLIGEHTDYNGGFVLPMAIDRSVQIAAGPNMSQSVVVHSIDYKECDRFELADIQPDDKRWSNYLRGVVKVMIESGIEIQGFDAVVTGDIPQGAGLSSSAAFEVAVAFLLDALSNSRLEKTALALFAQRAENEFVGVQCGIMDQFASALAQVDSCLLLDCRSLEFNSIPLNLETSAASIVVTNSGVQRGLVDSAYNIRRQQCNEGAAAMQQILRRPIGSLRDVSLSELNSNMDKLSPIVAKRCRHVISENRRVIEAAEALKSVELPRFGELMDGSHVSLRDDFEVSCPQVDLLVQLSRSHRGCFGSRMTGGGFGGCIVSLMETSALATYQSTVVDRYEKETGRVAQVYICKSVPGASVVEATLNHIAH